MSAMERAREAVANAIRLDRSPTWGGAADNALSALASLPLPDRLALLLSESERAEVVVVPRVATEAMQIAGHRVRTQHLDGQPPSGTDEIYAAMIAASEAAHAG